MKNIHRIWLYLQEEFWRGVGCKSQIELLKGEILLECIHAQLFSGDLLEGEVQGSGCRLTELGREYIDQHCQLLHK